MIVREEIRHGDYRNIREQIIEPTFAGVVELLRASPYAGAEKTAEQYAANRYVVGLYDGLLATGRGSLGWADYRVVEK